MVPPLGATVREGLAVENGRDERRELDELPDASLFWRWAARATRPVVGWVLIAVGALAILLGYLGVSRESLVAKQIPFMVSGGITGMVLVAVGAFFLGTEDLRRQLQRLDRIEQQVDDLHRVLLVRTDALGASEARGAARESNGAHHGSARLVAVPGGETYHRADCRMVSGKSGLTTLTARTIARRGLAPCPLCEPEPVTA